MKYNEEIIGNQIMQERVKKGLTQKELGKLINVSGKQISNYEHGVLMPPLDVLLELCNVFDCELGYLLGEEKYADGTSFQTAMCEELRISKEATQKIKEITGTKTNCVRFGYESKQCQRIFNALLTSKCFRPFFEQMIALDDCLEEDRLLEVELKEELGEELYDKACEIYDSPENFSKEKLSSKDCEAVQKIGKLMDQHQEKIYQEKIARYELHEAFEDLVDDLYPRKKQLK